MTDFSQNIWSGLQGGDAVEAPGEVGAVEIWAFTKSQSHAFGERVELFVHTNADSYDIEIINDTRDPQVVARFSDISGRRQPMPANLSVDPCEWESPFVLEPQANWGTGAFVALLHASRDGESMTHEAFFVIRPAARAKKRIAQILTTATWQAYNDWGRGNHYRSVEDGVSTDTPLPEVTRHRPWAKGLVRLPEGAPRHSDVADLALGERPVYAWLRWALDNGFSRHFSDAGWAHYEQPFAHWMHVNRYEFDILTQDDLHLRPDCLDGYDVAILVGHDEYWSWEMRDTMDAFIEGGGRLARFAGNMIWQIRIEGDDPRQICYRLSSLDPIAPVQPDRASTHWDAKAINRPAAHTFGLSGMWGCYHHFGMCMPRSPAGYTVYRPDHWAMEGTDLQYGDLLGGADTRILAFEVDGVDYGFRFGLPYATGREGAPPSMEIIGLAPATVGEPENLGMMVNAPVSEAQSIMREEEAIYERPEESMCYGAAVMASFTKGRGEVFNSGCCEWVSGLIKRDAAVEIVTRNVLNRFLRRGDD